MSVRGFIWWGTAARLWLPSWTTCLSGCSLRHSSPAHPPAAGPFLTRRGNFLYDEASGRINLIDFGAAKDYPAHFVADYLEMVRACAERDRQQVIERSTRLGFLTGVYVCVVGVVVGGGGAGGVRMIVRQGAMRGSTAAVITAFCLTDGSCLALCVRCCPGDESPVMLDAHVEAGIMVGLPFGHQGVYDFGSHGGLTKRVSELGAVMLKHRLTPVSAERGGGGPSALGPRCPRWAGCEVPP